MVILINISLAFSLMALCFYLAGYVLGKEKIYSISAFLLLASWAFSLAYCVVYSIQAGRLPLSNQYESVLLLAQFVLAATFYFYFLGGRKISLLLPSLALSPVFYSMLNLLDSSVRPLMPALRSNWLFFHVFTAMVSYSFFAVAGIRGLIYFIKKNANEGGYCLSLVKAGFAMLTIAIITGAVWAENAWNRYWSWDPKETWSLITWLYYAAVLHLRKGKIDNRTFMLSLFIGLLIVIFTYFGVNYLLSGLHSYA
ncbi:MAG: c-type cytochrome biogenesis protein CcsB [Elusimicrobiota bacterium]